VTKLLSIIGYPIGHTLSPGIYNTTFPAMGIDARYEAWSTPAEDVPQAITRLREAEMLGMNVTVPHKEAVIELLDEVDATARAIGAVNCISKDGDRLVGHNTDMYGFVRSLREAGCEPAGLHAMVLGVGGSARAVTHGLLEAGVASLALAGRTRDHVEALADALTSGWPKARVQRIGWLDEGFVAAARSADLVVNCTPIGMRHSETEHESPLPAELLRPGLWVFDLVANPLETCLLSLAREAGARPIGGLEMLVYQAVESVRHWTGRQGPVDIMREAARQALAGKGA
jgi:shikimate dehydrogenase